MERSTIGLRGLKINPGECRQQRNKWCQQDQPSPEYAAINPEGSFRFGELIDAIGRFLLEEYKHLAEETNEKDAADEIQQPQKGRLEYGN